MGFHFDHVCSSFDGDEVGCLLCTVVIVCCCGLCQKGPVISVTHAFGGSDGRHGVIKARIFTRDEIAAMQTSTL